MGLGSVSWDVLIPPGVRLMVLLLVVLWPVVSDMTIYEGFLDMYVFCMLHVLYIYLYILCIILPNAEKSLPPTPEVIEDLYCGLMIEGTWEKKCMYFKCEGEEQTKFLSLPGAALVDLANIGLKCREIVSLR
jgi:hypothetical protein